MQGCFVALIKAKALRGLGAKFNLVSLINTQSHCWSSISRTQARKLYQERDSLEKSPILAKKIQGSKLDHLKSQIRSLIDFAFIPNLSTCQKIATNIQTLQIRALRYSKHFPLKTSTKDIHAFFKIELVKHRDASTAWRFARSRQQHKQPRSDYCQFIRTRTFGAKYKHKNIFETPSQPPEKSMRIGIVHIECKVTCRTDFKWETQGVSLSLCLYKLSSSSY